MEHEQRINGFEGRRLEWQRTDVPPACPNSGIVCPVPKRDDKVFREIQSVDRVEPSMSGQRDGPAARPASGIQDAAARGNAGEVEKRSGELPAPPAHAELIILCTLGDEVRRHCPDRAR